MIQTVKRFDVIPDLEGILSHYPETKGVFFDMDGTLLNTEPLHALALELLLKKKNALGELDINSLQSKFEGFTDSYVYLYLQENHHLFPFDDITDFLLQKNQCFFECLDSDALWTPEPIRELLEELNQNELKVAMVTSAEKPVVKVILEKLNLKDLFPFILTREDTVNNKPHPEPYRRAMEHYLLEGHDVLVFEDSEVGIKSAMQAGCHVAEVKWFD